MEQTILRVNLTNLLLVGIFALVGLLYMGFVNWDRSAECERLCEGYEFEFEYPDLCVCLHNGEIIVPGSWKHGEK